ncbi:MAG: AAA family ATPase [Caldilineaceae bacterium]
MTRQQLSIGLLGDFRLTYGCQTGAETLYTVNTSRLQALLAYLLLHRAAPQAREHLAFLFWPNTSEAQALTNLRNLLYKLRHALPTPDAFLRIDAHSVQWRADVPYTLDVADFEDAVAQATTPAALEVAIALYHGDLLPSCYEDWILPERERLRQLALTALERLITLLEAQRDYGAAIRAGQRLLQLEPLNEALYRRLMSFYAANDDRAGALRLYRQCAAMLQEEFAAEPAPATQELYQRLQSAAPTPPSQAHHATEQLPLVGRTPEWQLLLDNWYRASSGQPHCLLLTGDIGIGKTRLAEELMTWVARQGFGTVSAHCYAAEGALAYAPVAAWLRAAPIFTHLATLEPVWLTEVARLLPELLVAQPRLSPPGPLATGWQRQRFFEALARALLNGQGPLLLFLDDLQWCDRDTLEWLHYLLRFAQERTVKTNVHAPHGNGRLLLVGTVRRAAIDDQHPLHTLLLTLRRDDQLTEVAVGPLNASATADLAAAVAGWPLSAAQNQALYQETEGNPLFVVETVRARSGAWWMMNRDASSSSAGVSAPRAALPPKLQAVIQARLAELSAPARELIGLAATIGRAFPLAVLTSASKQDEETLVNALDELCQRHIVRERGADTYDFTHDKLREATYNSLSAARRRLLHKGVAHALETVYANQNGTGGRQSLDAVSGQIATHYELAGVFDAAICYYQQAAAAAQHISANGEAVRAYRRALALLEGPAGQPPAVAVTLYERLGDLLHGLSQYDEARTRFSQALNRATVMDTAHCARLHRKVGNTWREQYHYVEALQCYHAAMYALEEPALTAPHRTTHEELPAAHPTVTHIQVVAEATPVWWEEWIQTQLEIDLVHYWLGATEASAALQCRLQPLVEAHGTPGQQAAFYQRKSQLSFRLHRSVATAEAVQAVQRSLDLYRDAGMQEHLPAAHFMLGFTLLWHDDLAAAAAELETTLRLAEQHGDLSLQARTLTYLTIAARRRNQAAVAEKLADQALAMATAAHMPEYQAMARANQAWLAWREHDHRAVCENGHAALELWRQLPVTHASAPFQWTALWPLLATALHTEAVTAAVDHARALLDPHQQQLPAALATPLTQALQAWENHTHTETLTLLQQAVARAEQLHYL